MCSLTDCAKAVGISTFKIPNYQFTASSSLDASHGPEKARLQQSTFWTPQKNDTNPWWKVDLGWSTEMTSIDIARDAGNDGGTISGFKLECDGVGDNRVIKEFNVASVRRI